MFDFAWSEIALIGVVALIAIGPKDMPVAIKGITDTIKKLRRMAGEFQHHVDDMMREADLGDVKSSIDELRSLNIRKTVQRTIDPEGTLAKAFEDPFVERKVPPVMTGPSPYGAAQEIAAQPVAVAGPPVPPQPAFIPPNAAPPVAIHQDAAPPPAFIPPAAVKGEHDHVSPRDAF